MGKKLTGWKTKGMNRDLSVSAFNPEFAFENYNLRLSTKEGNTTLSWVNERGPAEIKIVTSGIWEGEDSSDFVSNITGTPIGTAVLNHQLVIFTHDSSETDYIYKLTYISTDSNRMLCVKLYEGNLNFDVFHPLETMVYYEAEYIQKVYWVDGKNQPRLININASKEQRNHWKNNNTCFDFAPAVKLNEVFTVTKQQAAGGLFAPGVIQYCFTYVNKYGQQTNIINVSSLEYLSHNDRGASPEEKVTCNCKITIENLDQTFDFIRLYSIQRTSLDLEPIVKILEDIDIPAGGRIEYTDNGTTGALIDPTELLYVGGKEIIANAMEDKDNTLFLGNITQLHANINPIQDYFKGKSLVSFNRDNTKQYFLDIPSGIYTHTNSLRESSKVISTFKGGEVYRFGFQLQKKTGEWSEPIYICDKENDYYPNIEGTSVQLPYAQASIQFPTDLDISAYDRVRPLVVYPTIGDRRVLCQGVLNPTVFNALDRIDNSPYAQASWFFRPNCGGADYKEVEGDSITNSITYITQRWGPNAFPTPQQENAFYHSFVPAGHTEEQKYFEDHTIPVYVFIGHIEEHLAMDILRRGYVSARRMVQGNHRWEKIDFWGGLILEKYGNDTYSNPFEILEGKLKYPIVLALIKKTPWEPKNEGDDNNYFKYDDDWGYERTVDDTFYMYENMKVAPNGLFYYVKPAGHPSGSFDTFCFNFQDDAHEAAEIGIKYHQAKFTSIIADTSDMSDEATALDRSSGGNTLRFKHYDSLYSTDDLVLKDENNKDLDIVDTAKQIEIQGSVNSFKSPFKSTSENENKDVNSNTQFFIDQSIVTLNSPDIEFDTEVQVYGTESLKLKIIGAIPIDANVSAHDIRISSAMLEEMHNWGHNQYEIKFGSGERNHNVLYKVGDAGGVGKRLVSDYLWNDVIVRSNKDYEDEIETLDMTCNYLIYPWQRKGSLNADPRTADVASSMLSTKKESTLLFSANTQYLYPNWKKDVFAQVVLTENSDVLNIRLPKQSNSTSSINYYANIDKILYNESGYKPITDNYLLNTTLGLDIKSDSDQSIVSGGTTYNANEFIKRVFSPIPMQYKSTSHAIIAMKGDSENRIPILPYYGNGENAINKYNTDNKGATFWGDSVENTQDSIGGVINSNCFLWLGELIKNPSKPFGGDSKEAIQANKWIVGGDAVPINNRRADLVWTEGDTYYQRYDCLKTYAYTPDDVNQVVEILSFMCETHVNIDGRYDRNRGQIDNTYIRPDIFNKLNTVYSQKNNFFLSQQIGLDNRDKLHYPNYITYTKAKTSGADVDLYTNVTLASTMELDGDKGEITSLNRFNNQLIAFQDTGISQLLYNENMMMSTDKGVPVEIANSGKVTGKTYLSNTIGCSNKWSICQTPSGIYFMDSNGKSIDLFNGQLSNLSLAHGFSAWSNQNIPGVNKYWDPVYADNFVSYYDKLNQEVLFINRETCLAYSEKVGAFTSFYSYEGLPYFCNLDDTGIWIRSPKEDSKALWRHQMGDYCKFFGKNKPYWTVVVGNPEPQTDKTFTNLEFRACVEGEGNTKNALGVDVFDNHFDYTFHEPNIPQPVRPYAPYLPFDYLETWNEYQHGLANLSWKNGHGPQLHHLRDNTAHLDRKFRIWRCDIPRDNYRGWSVFDSTFDDTFQMPNRKVHPLDRMRNPWLYLKLMKKAASERDVLHKTEIHDLVMTYFN